MRFSVLALVLTVSAVSALDAKAWGRRRNDCCAPPAPCCQPAAPAGGCCGAHAMGTYAGWPQNYAANSPAPMPMTGGIIQTSGVQPPNGQQPVAPAGGAQQPQPTSPNTPQPTPQAMPGTTAPAAVAGQAVVAGGCGCGGMTSDNYSTGYERRRLFRRW
jgi:hypothetical protein